MTLTSAYLLVSHGSRDPRPQIALERLSYLVQQHLQAFCLQGMSNRKNARSAVLSPVSSILVETASLELASVSLAERIQQFAEKACTVGINCLKIVPLFLLPGVHVREDIPREVAIAQQALGNTIKLELCPYLGSYEGLINILSCQFSSHPQDARIIIAHGSRRPGGNQSVETMANRLNATVAYWSIAPNLQDQIYALVKQQNQSITILPYFLFTGGITSIIEQQVKQLQQSLPKIEIKLGNPLGATAELAKLMVEEITR
ncbi:sirohydrochlorin chelatase [Crocosphaera sp. XPORK-15E]|uniref:sirohydrochlorin chelatase n=1 Tax=Crocosphaera sp. XPORK-15E TaxID=3110247 RepID=UPI002B208BEF|nr:sirohydrochlorin chelatase [Crocosphaera sp. XPORK-15E]MEA5533754.1 sirohydrochlorin chelatase [Crocosphaera sp. XPORK-15E]